MYPSPSSMAQPTNASRLASHHDPPTNPRSTGILRNLSHPATTGMRVGGSVSNVNQHSQATLAHPQQKSMLGKMKEGCLNFFGVGDTCTDQTRWLQRRNRHFSRRIGSKDPLKKQHRPKLKQYEVEVEDGVPMKHIVDPLARPTARGDHPSVGFDVMEGPSPPSSALPRSARPLSTATSGGSYKINLKKRQQLRRKESVASMGWTALKSVSNWMTALPKDSSAKTMVKGKPPLLHSRSFAPAAVTEDDSDEEDEVDQSFFTPPELSLEESMYDEVFFDYVPPTGSVGGPGYLTPQDEASLTQVRQEDTLDAAIRPELKHMVSTGKDKKLLKKPVEEKFMEAPLQPEKKPIRRNKISAKILDTVFDNSDRREYGLGLLGDWLDFEYKESVLEDQDFQRKLEDMDDHRPFFTYWVTFVQILITIVSLAVYGIAPLGFTQTQETALVQMTHLAVESVAYTEPDNLWIGPKSADLIHLGAKYAPCMRSDDKIASVVEAEHRLENTTGCCIRNDQSGCIQAHESKCSDTFSTLHLWKDDPDSAATYRGQPRQAGPVCGQDPRSCNVPASSGAGEWPDDLTLWPVCRDIELTEDYENIMCELTGHPCCVGIQAECLMATREYCDFVNGHFHEEAFLCSQVECMEDICGLITFLDPKKPDQVYRLWLPLFIHAGVFHCVLTVIFQMTLMRDLEKLAGWARIGIIYTLSGIAGNLLSSIALPYRAEVGPAGAIFGILACMLVELIQSWSLLESPWTYLLRLVVVITLLLLLGLLPWIDNFAHMGGFVAGILLSFIFLPYISIGGFSKRTKLILIAVSAALFAALMTVLFVVFYVIKSECSWCQYLNCIPVTDNFCNYMDTQLDTREIEVIEH